jgi:uncharacterized protein YeaO (DUF488 family)
VYDRIRNEGYSDDETFEEVYDYWYSQYDRFEGEDPSWKYCNIKEKSWLEQVFEEMDEEERWKKESQLITKDSNATATIHTASISDVIRNKAPQCRIIAITRSRPKDWRYECKPILAPSWRLLKEYKGGYITYPKFRDRYLNEMRYLYCSTTILQEFAKECMQESVVLCCYCKSDEFCARAILKEILEKIIHKLKQKVEYQVPQQTNLEQQ